MAASPERDDMTKIINKGVYGFNACGYFFPRGTVVETSEEVAEMLIKKYNQAGRNFYFVLAEKPVEAPVEKQVKPIESPKKKRGRK